MSIPVRHPEALHALLEKTLSQAPHDIAREDSWLFVYGSMLENPPFEAAERRVATLRGFHRSFCLADPMLRGTEERPGLTLGLEAGGQCVGLAWRLVHEHARSDIGAFWSGEMEMPLYNAVWLGVELEGVGETPALTLLADPSGPLFEPDLARATVIARLARCAGSKGSNADYLRLAAGGLRRAGAPDAQLDDLVAAVSASTIQDASA